MKNRTPPESASPPASGTSSGSTRFTATAPSLPAISWPIPSWCGDQIHEQKIVSPTYLMRMRLLMGAHICPDPGSSSKRSMPDTTISSMT